MSARVKGDRRAGLAAIRSAAMADRRTPLIRNAWYVAARGDEIGRKPLGRLILGRSIVLFRREDGTPVALQNRCAHRSFPLSDGRLDGDTLVCRYHGLRYDCEGRCIEVPSQNQAPANIRIRSYPLREKGPFVWIWTGDAGNMDESALPHQDWLDSPEWDRYTGYLFIKANYVHMHENLLDLSHLSFLHETTFGTPEYARAPIELTVEESNFEVWRHVECRLPAIYARPLQWEGDRALRSSGAQFVAPGLHINTGILKNLERPDANPDPLPTIKVAQLITPADQDSFHYYYCGSRNFARNSSETTEFMQNAQFAAFSEDLYALENIKAMQDADASPGFAEIDVGADRAGVAMRRYLKKLADAEQAAEPAQ